jgi:ATP-dependent DNA ligase
LVSYEGFLNGIYEVEYIKRLEILEELILNCKDDLVSVTEYKRVYSYKEALRHFKELLDRGEEGSVLKTLEGFWEDTKPSHQVKLKLEMELELRIVGFNRGKPKTKYKDTLGSLQVESEDGLLTANMSGITDALRDEIWNNQELWMGKIITGKCNGVSKNKKGGTSLYYPNYGVVRDDKTVANTLPEIMEIQRMKLELEDCEVTVVHYDK